MCTGRYVSVVSIATLVLLGLAAAANAQEPTDESGPEVHTSMLHASGWCVVRQGKPPDTPEGEGVGEGEGEDTSETPGSFTGCDIGVGLSLARFHRLSWVVVLGSKSLGTGLAWVVSKPNVPGPVVAIALGIAAQYDSGGVYVGEVYPAVGATLSFGRATVGEVP